ncbi:CaiB/BaiF CoA transferase family protein [Altericroceibacterium endophyticum]|uniref:CoA transferase n=1 Tax=Altericroceibacterium endophyticum TaxID=1808508 RepID=A0A6I4T762_9SPHN|nr:CoA transferase [Altericroceibacterium endophyticum]MXO66329.1 CoA transferase [Altericroceibacterium endophyticum]
MLSLLRGIRVLDLTTVVLGPYASQILADMGAEVTKVEPPTGDVFRSVRPGRSEKLGAGFINTNRNKKSIAVDLQTPEGRKVLADLTRNSDVVVHNMRPVSAKKLGLDFETLKSFNHRIIYCYAAGFGQGGSNANEPAYDDTIQAASGLAYLNANAQGEPRFLPTIIADKVGGLHLAIAVLGALASEDRGKRAMCIEAPMFESLISFLLVEQLAGKTFDPALGGIGYDRLLSPYRKPFKTSDGFVSIIPYNGTHWARFLELVGRDDLATDPRVLDPVKRSQNIDMLYAVIEESTPDRTTDEWIELLSERDIPHAKVNRVEELFEHPHLKEVGMFSHVQHPTEGSLLSVRTPFSVSDDTASQPDSLAPALGQHTREVLRAIGYDKATIDELLERDIVRSDEETSDQEKDR